MKNKLHRYKDYSPMEIKLENDGWKEHYGVDTELKKQLHDDFLKIMQYYYDATGDVITSMNFGAIGIFPKDSYPNDYGVIEGEGFQFETEPGSEFEK